MKVSTIEIADVHSVSTVETSNIGNINGTEPPSTPSWVQHFYGPGGSGHDAGWEEVQYFGGFNASLSRWYMGYTNLIITINQHLPDWFTGYRPTQCRISYTVNKAPYANCTITDRDGGVIGTGLTPNLSTSCTFDLDFSAGKDIFNFNLPGVDRVTNIEFYG